MSTSSRHNDPEIVLPSIDGAPPRVIRDCKWRIRTFVERDAYLEYDFRGTSSPGPADVITDDHVRVMNSAMRARSSRAGWDHFVGKPVPELREVAQDLDLVDSSDDPVWAGWQSLHTLTQRISEVKGLREMAASKVLYLLRPQFVAIADSYIRQRLGIPENFASEWPKTQSCAARLIEVQRRIRELGHANRLALQLLHEYGNSLPPLRPSTGTFSGKVVPVKLSKARILDILIWTDVAVDGDTPHAAWSAWYAAEVRGRA